MREDAAVSFGGYNAQVKPSNLQTFKLQAYNPKPPNLQILKLQNLQSELRTSYRVAWDTPLDRLEGPGVPVPPHAGPGGGSVGGPKGPMKPQRILGAQDKCKRMNKHINIFENDDKTKNT